MIDRPEEDEIQPYATNNAELIKALTELYKVLGPCELRNITLNRLEYQLSILPSLQYKA